MVPGIVLAAGRSERMGREKALLDLEGRSFLHRAVGALRDGGCDPVLVVVRAGADGVESEARSAGGIVVRNEAKRSEQVESIRLALGAAPEEATAAVVLPVDHPLVAAGTVARLIEAHHDHASAIVRPVLRGRPGHPTLFPRSVWPALSAPDLPRGAESVVESGEFPRVDLDVNDRGIVADIDTPEAYRSVVAGRQGMDDG